MTAWQPAASHEALELRARALGRIRAFFSARAVLEVTTPVMVRAPVTDVHLSSASVTLPGDESAQRFLHTSPEYAMKRLLASGSGDIYQICPVVRGHERGRLHNPEFTLLEWYRTGFTLMDLMQEVHSLVETVLERACTARFVTYAEAFREGVGLDALGDPDGALRARARSLGLSAADSRILGRDALLDYILSVAIAPELGRGELTFLHRYPASQAALARLDPEDARVALRFELYLDGIELANGFDELSDRAEQQSRFEADLRERRTRGLPALRIDERLLAALDHGLPRCCGVALGIDRLLMCAGRFAQIDSVLTFPDETA